MRNLKRGQGKYKCKLHFKCFKCGRISHFASKCTFKENKDNDSDEELEYQVQRNAYQHRKVESKKKLPNKRKSLYSFDLLVLEI